MVGQYKVDSRFKDLAQFPNAIKSEQIGGAAVDSKAGIIYAQILVGNPQGTSTATDLASALTGTAPAEAAGPPVLSILDADNLTVRERISLPENIVGRALLSSNSSVMYAVTDSGITVLPVGRLAQQRRLVATQSDILASGNFCNRNIIIQQLTITDPGGGNTDFHLSADLPE
jgi:hypothetical protein